MPMPSNKPTVTRVRHWQRQEGCWLGETTMNTWRVQVTERWSCTVYRHTFALIKLSFLDTMTAKGDGWWLAVVGPHANNGAGTLQRLGDGRRAARTVIRCDEVTQVLARIKTLWEAETPTAGHRRCPVHFTDLPASGTCDLCD